MNFDEFLQVADDVSVAKHPLASQNLTSDVKAAYLGLVAMALFLDDNQLSTEEIKQLRSLGCSLDIPIDDIKTIQDNVLALAKDDAGQLNFIRETTPLLKERDVAMFVYCDMVKFLLKRGELTADAKSFLKGITKFLGLSAEDTAFLNEYTPFLAEGKGMDATEVVMAYQGKGKQLPDDFVPFYTPDMKPVELKGGQLPPGETRICNGKYVLNTTLTAGPDSVLIIKDAEIYFGAEGRLEVKNAKTEFIRSAFIAQAAPAKDVSISMLSISSDAPICFEYCTFEGNAYRYLDVSYTIFKNCVISRINNPNGKVIAGYESQIFDSEIKKCSGKSLFSDLRHIQGCYISDCSMQENLIFNYNVGIHTIKNVHIVNTRVGKSLLFFQICNIENCDQYNCPKHYDGLTVLTEPPKMEIKAGHNWGRK